LRVAQAGLPAASPPKEGSMEGCAGGPARGQPAEGGKHSEFAQAGLPAVAFRGCVGGVREWRGENSQRERFTNHNSRLTNHRFSNRNTWQFRNRCNSLTSKDITFSNRNTKRVSANYFCSAQIAARAGRPGWNSFRLGREAPSQRLTIRGNCGSANSPARVFRGPPSASRPGCARRANSAHTGRGRSSCP